ncbi:hypothetical protein SS50377_24295 [Spironucleus salmonicida]|uniref:Uncharacterized protein n=1 Tax=Spironucleus salmonicida TaxID=348837 RepID=V6LJR2_9EUKA|nr:hypothetical protein SS50377_24295 [Spironucleus salmonicida]|eukprot:EST44835.1 Hypothetical protein SS50377_15281 [Spironucleus salmonicida]
MQLNASILLKQDRTVNVAHFHVPIEKSHGMSLVDQIIRNLPKNTNSGTLQIEDFQIAYEHPIILLAQSPANARLLIQQAQQLSREIHLAGDPFESLFLLQESLFQSQTSVQQRIKMHSDVEEKHLAEQKRKLDETNALRKIREGELKRQGGQQGHGIDEHTLRELRQRALQSSAPVFKEADKVESLFKRADISDDSDDSDDKQIHQEAQQQIKKKVSQIVIKKSLKR